jgi:hypothetical protein
VSETNWSKKEKKIAQEAFKKAYEREISALIEQIRSQASEIDAIDEVWQLHDFLSAKRHDIDGKYDYRYSVLIFVFARLVKEGWLSKDELQDLEQDKLAKILALTRM